MMISGNAWNISSLVFTSKIHFSAGQFRMYPNPVVEALHIETDQAIASIELFNALGVKIMDVAATEGKIDMGHLERAIYFIRIKTDRGEIYTGKVMKKQLKRV